MLDRYQKSGGFLQLLNLIETCGPTKQEKFLLMIREEDPRWADAIEKKMLSIKKIFSWNQDMLAEIMGNLQDLTMAVALHGLDTESRDKIYKTLSHGQRRKIDELFQSQKPTQAEIATMFMKIIIEVRKMVSEGHLRLDKVDHELVIAEDIEEHLKKGVEANHEANTVAAVDGTTLNFEMAEVIGTGAHADGHAKDEIQQLRRKMMALNQENTQLKAEVTKLKVKLDHVRKAVA